MDFNQDNILKYSLSAIIRATPFNGLNVYSLLYSKPKVQNVDSDLLMFLQEASNPNEAKHRIESTFKEVIKGFDLIKLVGLEFQYLKDNLSNGQIRKHNIREDPVIKETPKTELLMPKENFVYNIMLLADKTKATKTERKVVNDLIKRFKKEVNLKDDSKISN